jgi:hypothetical protein
VLDLTPREPVIVPYELVVAGALSENTIATTLAAVSLPTFAFHRSAETVAIFGSTLAWIPSWSDVSGTAPWNRAADLLVRATPMHTTSNETPSPVAIARAVPPQPSIAPCAPASAPPSRRTPQSKTCGKLRPIETDSDVSLRRQLRVNQGIIAIDFDIFRQYRAVELRGMAETTRPILYHIPGKNHLLIGAMP